MSLIAENWESIADHSGKTMSSGAIMGQMRRFAKRLLDLKGPVQSMYQDSNKVTVRNRVNDAPIGSLFGVDAPRWNLNMVAIEDHKLENSLIVRSYHVEKREDPLQQLSGGKISLFVNLV